MPLSISCTTSSGQPAPSIPAFTKQPLNRRTGFIYVIDLRTPDGPQGDVPWEDVIGWFKVENGQLVPGSYEPNEDHRILTENGPVQLPRSMQQALVEAALEHARIQNADTSPSSSVALERWSFVAFRSRVAAELLDNYVLKQGDMELKAEKVFWTARRAGNVVNVRFLSRACCRDRRKGTAFAILLLLDHALGEYDVETRIGRIDLKPYEAGEGLPLQPLKELPALIDRDYRS